MLLLKNYNNNRKKGLIWIKYLRAMFESKRKLRLHFHAMALGSTLFKSMFSENKRIIISSIVWTLVCESKSLSERVRVCSEWVKARVHTKYDAIYHSNGFTSCEWIFSNLSISRQIQFIYMAFYFLSEKRRKYIFFSFDAYMIHIHTYIHRRDLWRLVTSLFYSKVTKKKF